MAEQALLFDTVMVEREDLAMCSFIFG